MREFSYDLMLKLPWDTPKETYDNILVKLNNIRNKENWNIKVLLPYEENEFRPSAPHELDQLNEEYLREIFEDKHATEADYLEEYLAEMLDLLDGTEDEYLEFCRINNYPATLDPPNKKSIIAFEKWSYGLLLAWIILNADKKQSMVEFAGIVEFARDNNLIISTLNNGFIDLASPGQFPLGYCEALDKYLESA